MVPVHAAPGATPSFATPVVVDNFRPGFEPTIAVDRRPGKGQIYVSLPNGFSTTESFVWRSDDAGTSFHLTEGNALGKTTTCPGGGDTEIQVDPVSGALYFVDPPGAVSATAARSTASPHSRSPLQGPAFRSAQHLSRLNDTSPNGEGNLIAISPPYTAVLGSLAPNVPETPWQPALVLVTIAITGSVAVAGARGTRQGQPNDRRA